MKVNMKYVKIVQHKLLIYNIKKIEKIKYYN